MYMALFVIFVRYLVVLCPYSSFNYLITWSVFSPFNVLTLYVYSVTASARWRAERLTVSLYVWTGHRKCSIFV